MAAVTKQDIPEVSNFMADFWKLIKAYWITEDSDDYWEELAYQATELDKRYGSTDFTKGQINAYLDYLDKKWHKERNTRKEANHGTG